MWKLRVKQPDGHVDTYEDSFTERRLAVYAALQLVGIMEKTAREGGRPATFEPSDTKERRSIDGVLPIGKVRIGSAALEVYVEFDADLDSIELGPFGRIILRDKRGNDISDDWLPIAINQRPFGV
jgi:hypothetical protein